MENGPWTSEKKYVLSEIDRLNTGYESLRQDITNLTTQIYLLREDLVKQKTSKGIIDKILFSIGGGLVVLIFSFLKDKMF